MSVALWCCKSFCVVPCVSFCTGHFVMVPFNITYLHWLQHSLFEHLFNLYCPHCHIVGPYVVLLCAIDNTPSLCSQAQTKIRRLSQVVCVNRFPLIHVLTSTYIFSLVFIIANIYSSWLIAHFVFWNLFNLKFNIQMCSSISFMALLIHKLLLNIDFLLR